MNSSKSGVGDSLKLLAIFVCWALLHIPFFTADPSVELLQVGRDALTDEGLYHTASRNAQWGIAPVGGFNEQLVAPLYYASQRVVFRLCGVQLSAARAATLIFGILALWLASSHFDKHRKFLLLLVPLGFLNPVVFHYAHYALAEFVCSALIAASLIFYARYSEQPKRRGLLWNAVGFSVFACFFKLQYLYALLLIPALALVMGLLQGGSWKVRFGNFLLALSGVLLLVCLLGSGWWITGNFEGWQEVYASTLSRAETFGNPLRTLAFNGLRLLKSSTSPWAVLVLVAVFALPVVWRWGSKLPHDRALVAGALLWWVAECHRLVGDYFPGRYQVAWMLAAGMLMASALWMARSLRLYRAAVWLVAVLGVWALTLVYRQWQERTFNRQNMEQEVAQVVRPGDRMLGSWAPSVAFNLPVEAYPLWNNYLDNRAILCDPQPAVLVVEPDDADTQAFFARFQHDLTELPALSKTRFGSFEVALIQVTDTLWKPICLKE